MARIGRPQGQALTLSDIERDELERFGRSLTATHSLVRRAQIILASADGETNTSIASRLGVSNPTICHWRKIWFEKGLMLPLGLGYIEGVTHDYVRHGTTTLFAALDIANGQVLTQCRARHRHQEFLGFLKHIEANVPSNLDLHLVVDITRLTSIQRSAHG